MKKLMGFMLALAIVFAATGAFAWDLTVTDANIATNIVLVPPIATADAQWSQYPVRSTGVVVAAGARYRLGRDVIVAAHAGTITNQTVTTTSYFTNGVATTFAGASNAVVAGRAVITNTVIACAPITVPVKGISGYDGTVRWYRARELAEDFVRIQLTIAGGTVTLTDSAGSTLTYTSSGIYDFEGFPGLLYINKSATNAVSARVMDW